MTQRERAIVALRVHVGLALRRAAAEHGTTVPDGLVARLVDETIDGLDERTRQVGGSFAGRARAEHQDRATSDIFHPDWRPGKGLRRRAEKYAQARGVSYEQALEKLIQHARDKRVIAQTQNARSGAETSELLRELRGPAPVFPRPQSVRDIPSGGFETNRRRH